MNHEFLSICMESESRNPVKILEALMSLPSCHMHGPEHHFLVGSALLTAYHNAGGRIDLAKSLAEMESRSRQVPGGACGFWGACGAGVSTGMFLSIVTQASPLAGASWGLANRMTGCALMAIGSCGGPRCCKRDSYLAVMAAVDFVKEHLGVEMEGSNIHCTRSEQNNQCRKENCPFYEAEK